MKVVVIGGVAAGMSAASKLKRDKKDTDITVYEKTDEISYGACGLPYYVAGINKDEDLIRIRTKQQIIDSGINLKTKHEVLSVDHKAKSVKVLDILNNKTFTDTYDKLVVASGSSPRIFGVAPDTKNVFTVKSIDDANRIIKKMNTSENVLVIGGGYIGIEMVEAFHRQGKKVTLLEGAPRLLLTFDSEISDIVKKYLLEKGIDIHTGDFLKGIENDGETVVVTTENNKFITDMAIMSVGVAPNTDFIKDTGIQMLSNGAIVVNDKMETSIPNIYAGGDCATVYHKILKENVHIPLGTNANKAGRLIGENIAGANKKFYGTLGTAMIKIIDIEAAATGLSEHQANTGGFDYDTVFVTAPNHAPYYPNIENISVKLIFNKTTQVLLGAQMIGGKGTALRINTFAACIDQGMTLEQISQLDMGYAPPFSTVWDVISIAASVGAK